MESVHISNTTKQRVPKLPYEEIKNDILGKQYQLSVTFVGTTRAQKLNQEHRNKAYIPNILSFPLSQDMGDIFICPIIATKEAKDFSLTPSGYVTFLLIHGCLHLKGYDHGATMDRLEARYKEKYRVK